MKHAEKPAGEEVRKLVAEIARIAAAALQEKKAREEEEEEEKKEMTAAAEAVLASEISKAMIENAEWRASDAAVIRELTETVGDCRATIAALQLEVNTAAGRALLEEKEKEKKEEKKEAKKAKRAERTIRAKEERVSKMNTEPPSFSVPFPPCPVAPYDAFLLHAFPDLAHGGASRGYSDEFEIQTLQRHRVSRGSMGL